MATLPWLSERSARRHRKPESVLGEAGYRASWLQRDKRFGLLQWKTKCHNDARDQTNEGDKKCSCIATAQEYLPKHTPMPR